MGDKVELYGSEDQSPETFVGYKVANKVRLGVSLIDVAECVKVGSIVRIQDGLINIEVTSVRPGGPVGGVALNHAFLGERKRVHLVGVTLHAPAASMGDLQAVTEFAIPNNVRARGGGGMREAGRVLHLLSFHLT